MKDLVGLAVLFVSLCPAAPAWHVAWYFASTGTDVIHQLTEPVCLCCLLFLGCLQVADATAAELSAGARLRELLAGRVSPSTQEGVAALAAAITAAEPFSSLAADVEAARELHEQSCARAEVAAQLQTVVDKVLRLTSGVSIASGSGSGSSGGGAAAAADRASSAGGSAGSRDDVLGLPLQGFSLADWQQYVAMLEAAVGAAKDAHVSVTKVRDAKVSSAFMHYQPAAVLRLHLLPAARQLAQFNKWAASNRVVCHRAGAAHQTPVQALLCVLTDKVWLFWPHVCTCRPVS